MTQEYALKGLMVLDLSRVLAGPYCTMMLADMGAEVIKVEMPTTGDDARSFGPFVGEESAYFMSLNRNKKSVTLNLKREEGREILKTLVQSADILVENYRPGTMDRLGLGYDVLSQINPALIYAGISGFGNTGPYRLKAAYDVVVQGMGGIMSITGFPDGKPTRVGASIGDITAATFGVIGILAALEQRHRTGKGQFVDVAMLDSQVAILENAIARYEVSGEAPGLIGNRHPSIAPFTSVEAADGHLIIAIGNDNLWRQFCHLVKRPDLATDDRYVTNRVRTENWPALETEVAAIFRSRTVDDWMDVLDEAGIPCGPINTVDKVLKDPQVVARNMVEEAEHPVAGKIRMAGSPIKMSAAPERVVRQASPTLGQHTAEVLRQLCHLTDEDIERLRVAGTV